MDNSINTREVAQDDKTRADLIASIQKTRADLIASIQKTRADLIASINTCSSLVHTSHCV